MLTQPDWYIRLAVVGGSPDLPEKEYSLSQCLFDTRGLWGDHPLKGHSPRPDPKVGPVPGGVILGRLSSSTKGDRGNSVRILYLSSLISRLSTSAGPAADTL